MLTANIKDWDKFTPELTQSHWPEIFSYLDSLNEPPGSTTEKDFAETTCKVIPLQHTYNLCVPFFEAHKKIIDLHFCLDGEEMINLADAETLAEIRPYREDADVTIYAAPENPAEVVHLKPGRFALLYPQDAHQPLQEVPGVKHVKKVIIKVPL